MPLPHRGLWLWEDLKLEDKHTPATLAQLRKAITRGPGEIPELWHYYRIIIPNAESRDFLPYPGLAAEHAALGLFGLHQQSQQGKRMHDKEVSLGAALRHVKDSGKYSKDALDRRVTAAATATSTNELVQHLRRLITQLRSAQQPLSYNQLVEDIYGWERPDQRKRIRRRWGAAYFNWARQNDPSSETTTDST
jgi:CRISPR system Cascade subunit CasB